MSMVENIRINVLCVKGKSRHGSIIEYGCRVLQECIGRLREVSEHCRNGKKEGMEEEMDEKKEEWTTPTREEWRLDMKAEDMTMEKMLIVAKARYVYEKTRSRTDYRQKKRIDIDMMLEEVKEQMTLVMTRERKKKKKKIEREKRGGGEKRDRFAYDDERERKLVEFQKKREREERGISVEQQEAEEARMEAYLNMSADERDRYDQEHHA